ncbi:unnamed protein product [Linum tenue]|uniref:Uncharacterized protein n=1 Tax=Linum tenue TaxID=586396 RepID=A0AAV0QHI9_9ROSI|nr:unnamed protein product [Linum tenue]
MRLWNPIMLKCPFSDHRWTISGFEGKTWNHGRHGYKRWRLHLAYVITTNLLCIFGLLCLPRGSGVVLVSRTQQLEEDGCLC